MLVDCCGKLPTGNRMLLLRGQSPDTTTNNDFRPLEQRLHEQGLEPGFELFIEVV